MTVSTIFIIDDHPIVCFGLTQLINAEPDLKVCADAEDARAALTKLREVRPDLILLDLSLRSSSGFDLLKQIRASWPRQKVLIISTHDEKLYSERLIRAGACGFMPKGLPAEQIVRTLRRALRGELIVGDELAASLLANVLQGQRRPPGSPLEGLSDRELEIFELIGRGLSARAITEALGISIKTVESHQFNIRSKLGACSMHELRRMAAVWSSGGGMDEPLDAGKP